jgi:hypothetical protein
MQRQRFSSICAFFGGKNSNDTESFGVSRSGVGMAFSIHAAAWPLWLPLGLVRK